MYVRSYRDRINEELDDLVNRLERLLDSINDSDYSRTELHDILCEILEDIG